jgi:hypothetical protein
VHIDLGTLNVLLAEVDDDFERVVANVENVGVSPFGLRLTHARLAIGAPRVSHHVPPARCTTNARSRFENVRR